MTRESESGLPIEPVYGPEALDGWRPEEKLGDPGAYPFTRGVYPTMYTVGPGRCGSTRDSAPPPSPTPATSS